MTQNLSPALLDLIALSQADGGLAQALAERKKLEAAVRAKMTELGKLEQIFANKKKVAEDKKSLSRQEERNLSDERSRVADRRKALKTLGTYKLQQAAEREIDLTARTLGQREDGLIKMINDAESAEKEAQTAQQALQAKQAEMQSFEADARATLATLEERTAKHQVAREELIKKIDPSLIIQYNKVKDKHPGETLVAIKGNSCTGCFMQIGPQIMVQIARGGPLQRCPGCGRILYLTPDEEKAGKEK